jgi:hypothetical protein
LAEPDWTYEDGERGFEAVKKQRDDLAAQVARLRAQLSRCRHRMIVGGQCMDCGAEVG